VNTPDSDRSNPARFWLTIALALAGLALSLYLTVASSHPVGCGAGSGCEQVLSSRWSGVGPVPVGALGGGAYLALIAYLLAPRSRRLGGGASLAWATATAIAVALVAAAAWFIALQLFVIRAVCPYCMAEHAVGCAAAILVLTDPQRRAALSTARTRPLVIGLAAVALLIGAQAAFPHSSRLLRLAARSNFDTGPGPDRTLGLLDGTLQLRPHEEPLLGSPDAAHLLVVLVDYACPHCRQTHEYLDHAVQRWPADLAVVVLPCPLNASCNPHIPETEPRFEDSCDLAKIALALRIASPDKFAPFDAWLFAPETPRTKADARTEADRLLGPPGVGASLAAPFLDQTIARNTAAFGHNRAGGADRLPIILSPEPGVRGIAGRPDSEEAFFNLLIKELHLPPGH